jgi:NDP-sugar pyrophosphorylase family protein
VGTFTFGDLPRCRAEVVGMDVRAIVIVGGEDTASERLAGVPLALLDVLGRSVLDRVVDRLHAQGVDGVTVIGNVQPGLPAWRREGVQFVNAGNQPPFRAAETVFSDIAQAGADVVLLLRLGPYAELDYEKLIQFHLDRAARVTCVVNSEGVSLDYFAISASRRNDAAYLLRSGLKQFRSGCTNFSFDGYCNALRSAAGLRELAIDAFSGANEIKPTGKEIRPGVWVANTARIHKGARLLAPCFIGERSKIMTNAVISRCSTVERGSCVDCGTVVENSTVLPQTVIGAGLDVVHSVVGFRNVAHLARGVEVEIIDRKLVDGVAAAPARAISQTVSLAGFLPVQMIKGMRRRRPAPVTLPQAVHSPSSALKNRPMQESSKDEEFSAPFVVARRYGND